MSDQEEEVKATLVKMWEAIENGNIELYASYVHPDFTQFGETDPVLKIGKDMGSTDGEAFSSRGKSTRIFVKEKGRWLYIHGHYTLLL